jgi:WD40 repeat protein
VLPDGRLASASWDRIIRLWNLGSGEVEATLGGHTKCITALAALPGGRLASGSDDHTVVLGMIAHGADIEWIASFVADAPVCCIAFCSDRKTIVVGDEAGRVHFLRVE